MSEGHFIWLEVLRLFYNESTTLLMKTYLSVFHPYSSSISDLLNFPSSKQSFGVAVCVSCFHCRHNFFLVPLKSALHCSFDTDGFVELEISGHEKYCLS